MKIKDVKKGEYVTLKPIEYPKDSQVWIRDEYDRSARRYMVVRFDDCSTSRLLPADREVFTDFIF